MQHKILRLAHRKKSHPKYFSGGVSKGQEMLIEFQSISSEDNSKNGDGEKDSPKITERIKKYCTLFCPCFNRQRQQVVPGDDT